MTIRLWPFYVWFHITAFRPWAQGGWWYQDTEKVGRRCVTNGFGWWYQGTEKVGRRCVTNGFAVRLGFTWPDKKTYRGNPYEPAEYLVLGGDD